VPPGIQSRAATGKQKSPDRNGPGFFAFRIATVIVGSAAAAVAPSSRKESSRKCGPKIPVAFQKESCHDLFLLET
jgi:hypothetical protein